MSGKPQVLLPLKGYSPLASQSSDELPIPTSLTSQSRRRRNGILLGLAALTGLALLARHNCGYKEEHIPHPYHARPDVPAFASPDNQRNPAYLIEATHGAVATENGVCSQTGVDVLKDGGNAVDAAIAATLCIGVTNMFSAGIGGGGFMTVRVPSSSNASQSEVWTIDFREVAPALANSTMFVGKSPMASLIGGLSIAVPAELRGLGEAHRRWGKLKWERLVQPSADIAAGARVGKELGKRIPWFPDLMLKNADYRAIFAPYGVMLKEGDIIRNTNLSRTLATIAREGPEAFYKGPIADSILAKINAEGGIFTAADFENSTIHVERALQGSYRGQKIYVPDAPTSGPVLLHMLNLAERLDLGQHLEKRDIAAQGRSLHLKVECMKFGFAARTTICDPAFNNQRDRIDEIPTSKYASLIVKNVTDDRTHPPEYYHPLFDTPIDHGTSHISTYSADGTAVSITSSVNLIFGSQVLDPVTGVILNDVMDDFSTPGSPNAFGLWPSPYNYPAPFKRPLSSIAPVIVEDDEGRFRMAVGGAGGSRIFGSVFQVLLNVAEGMDVRAAVEAGRAHDQLFPLMVDVDDVLGAEMAEALATRGHNVSVTDVNGVKAVVNAIVRDGDRIFAASDSRKNGIAAGW